MNTFEILDIGRLHFDKDNPRLPTSVRGQNESTILKYLATKTSLENLMVSIGLNGFFPGEAIVVMPKDTQYIVLEGNRRLAAVRLLQDPSLVGVASIERAAREAINKPTQIPVYIVDSREDTLQYLGFRHISGVQRWDALAKARYLESLFTRTQGDSQDRYTAVAREIGSTNTAVRRNLDALAAYKIIEGANFYDIPGIEEESFHFGTFYTTVSNSDIADFIGTRANSEPSNPIVNLRVIIRAHLEELVRWLFERDSRGSTTLGESRNIGKLGFVLANSLSLDALRSGQSLEAAYRLTSHGRDDFVRHMNQAVEELKQANANLYSVTRNDETAKRLIKEALKIIEFASNTLGVQPDA